MCGTRVLFALFALLALVAAAPVSAVEPAHLRLGLVKFGTAAWEIDTMRSHGMDRAAGIAIDVTDLANPAAGEVALQAGAVDAIFTDWLWVSRQRAAGQHITFVPHTLALGEILVPADSAIHAMADLDGKRIGVAGGPLDKSWLLVRAYSRRRLGYDLADRAHIVYAAPPLLSQELAAGRIDAVLTYWPFAARLAVHGFRPIATMADILRGVGFEHPLPLLGYAFSESWIAAHPGAAEAFLSANRQATAAMAESDAEWLHLRPLTGAEDDATLVALRDRFRKGILAEWKPANVAELGKLYGVLGDLGGADLTGGAKEISAGTFWRGAPR
jgi:NitT/TauT family transport system substrate-binding protein